MSQQKIIIVDDRDVPIGTKFRREVDHTKETYRASAIWLYNSQGEILIARRSAKKKTDPCKWGPAVAGTLEEGETYESNARKEAAEEIGLRNITLEPGPKLHADAPRKYFIQWFYAKSEMKVQDFVLQKDEVDEVKWVDRKKLLEDIDRNSGDYAPSMENMVRFLVGPE